MRVLQVHIHPTKAATATLQEYVTQQGLDLAPIHEQCLVKCYISGLVGTDTGNLFTQFNTNLEYVSLPKSHNLTLWGYNTRDLMPCSMRSIPVCCNRNLKTPLKHYAHCLESVWDLGMCREAGEGSRWHLYLNLGAYHTPQAKFSKPTSVSSSLLKNVKKLIDRHIRDDALKVTPVYRNYFAYQTGKSWS